MSNQQLTVDQFYEQGRAGRLLGLRCESGHVTVPPRRSCRVCQSLNMQVIELAQDWQGCLIHSCACQIKRLSSGNSVYSSVC